MLGPDGTINARSIDLQADGSIEIKFPWWRAVDGPLRISGRRLDATSTPLRSYIPDGYGSIGFQATGLIFPKPGCWEVTGAVGSHSLTFVTRIVNPAR